MSNEAGSRSRIPGLDGLRGMAAMLVLLAHLSEWGYPIAPGLDLSGIGGSGVMLFFVLSAFLLTSQVLNWPSHAIVSVKRWLIYFEARFLRIWPLYIVVLAFAVLTTYMSDIPFLWKAVPFLSKLPVPMSFESLGRHLLLEEGRDILWSIPVEFKFYFLLPVILLAILIPLRDYRKVSMALLASGILLAHEIYPFNVSGVDTLPYIGVFLTGVLLAFVWQGGRVAVGASEARIYEAVAWLCLFIFIFIVPSIYLALTGVGMPFIDVHAHALYATLWAVMILSMLRGTGGMRNLLESRAFAFLGCVSFSLYLWHRVPMYLMHRLTYFHRVGFLPVVVKSWIIIVVALGLAKVSYVLVERPVQRWRSKLKKARQLPFDALKLPKDVAGKGGALG